MKTYRDGLVDACKCLEFYLWFAGVKAPDTAPMWQPYIDLGNLLHITDGHTSVYQWYGEMLSVRFAEPYKVKSEQKNDTDH